VTCVAHRTDSDWSDGTHHDVVVIIIIVIVSVRIGRCVGSEHDVVGACRVCANDSGDNGHNDDEEDDAADDTANNCTDGCAADGRRRRG
jgi:hypothetical protein